MKGSPARLGTIQGTAGHTSALKMMQEKESALKMMQEKKARRRDENHKAADSAKRKPMTPEQKAKMDKRMAEIGKQKGQAKKSPPLKLRGAFVDGERATYDAARKAESEGGNVTYTNKEARKRNKEDLNSKDKSVKSNAENFVRNTTGDNEYKGEKGKEKDFARAKAADAKAQSLLERRTKNLARKGKKDAGVMDADGRKGSNAKIAGEKAFEERNKDIKTETIKTPTGRDHQGVKGASETISTKGAQKGVTGSKNKADYKKEARGKKVKGLKSITPLKKGKTSVMGKLRALGKGVSTALRASATENVGDSFYYAKKAYNKSKKESREAAEKNKKKK